MPANRMDAAELDRHCTDMLTRMERGSVVPFLGAGANRCGRPDGAAWGRDSYLPDGGELSKYLADTYRYPGDDRSNLGRVSQFVALELEEMALYTDLREIFTGGYEPTPLHVFLAELSREMRERGRPQPFQLVVTTNYDDALERAFARRIRSSTSSTTPPPPSRSRASSCTSLGDRHVRVHTAVPQAARSSSVP